MAAAHRRDERDFITIMELEISADVTVVHGDHTWGSLHRGEPGRDQVQEVAHVRARRNRKFETGCAGCLAVRSEQPNVNADP
jgi:hypothetical protein